jgi:hypothetical protein
MNPLLSMQMRMRKLLRSSGEIVVESATLEPGSQCWHTIQMHAQSSWQTEDLLDVASQHIMSLARLD